MKTLAVIDVFYGSGGRAMDFAQLEAFERAAREGSFTRAGDVLGLTQPSVSARIKGLERELGGSLFERGRVLRLTALGKRFLPYARRALGVVEEGQRAVQDMQAGRTGTIVIAALTTEMTWLLPPVLYRFRQAFPLVDLRVTPRVHFDIPAALYDHMATLGLTGQPHYDVALPILAEFEVPVVCYVGSNHPLAGQGPLRLADLCEHTIARVNLGPEVVRFVEGLIEDAREQTGAALFSLPALMAPDFVLSGHGVAFLPEPLMVPHEKAGQVVKLNVVDMPRLTQNPVVITLGGHEVDAPTQALVRMIKAQWRQYIV